VNRALTHTPGSFVEFLDARYAPDVFEFNDTGGYKVHLDLDPGYLENEKRSRRPPVVRFDDDEGDDYMLLVDDAVEAEAPDAEAGAPAPAPAPAPAAWAGRTTFAAAAAAGKFRARGRAR